MTRLTRAAPWLVVIFLSGAYISARRAEARETLTSQMMHLIGEHAIHPVPQGKLEAASIKEMVKGLGDPYASVFTPTQRSELDRVVSAAYGGVGVEVHPVNGQFVVDEVFPNSPASEVQLARGDTISVISGSLDGEEGDEVVMDIHNGTTRRVSLTRRSVHVPSVVSVSCSEGIGYMHLLRIEHGAGDEIRRAARDIMGCAEGGWILDLRGNRGGDMGEAMEILGAFLGPNKVGAIVQLRHERERYVTQGDPLIGGPVAIVVDEQTASAAEVVAGALQDWRRGRVIGTRTWGKGVVQTIYDLSQGYAVKMTTGTWTTPLGRWVGNSGSGKGLAPDIAAGDSVSVSVARAWLDGGAQ